VARRIVVIDEDRLARDALEHPHVLVGERRSLPGDGVREAARMEANAVDLPFADYHLAVGVLSDRAARAVEPEEDVGLLEDRRLRGIHVLAGVLLLDKLPPRERDDPALLVAHGKHKPPAEAVVAAVARPVRRLDDACGLELFRRVLVLLGPAQDVRDAVRRVADPPVLRDGAGEGAALKVFPRGLALLRLKEAAAVERGELGHQRVEALAEARVGVFGLLDLDAALLGELLHGLDEREALLLLHELDCIARLAAAEAVVEPLGRIDVEGRGLLVVERAARLRRRPGVLHLYAVRRYQFGEVDPRLDILDYRLCDSHCH